MLAGDLMGGQCGAAVVSCGDVMQCRASLSLDKNMSVCHWLLKKEIIL